MAPTKKEEELLQKLSEGDSAKQIAVFLNVSLTNIERKIEDMLKKYSCRNRVELVAKWLRSLSACIS